MPVNDDHLYNNYATATIPGGDKDSLVVIMKTGDHLRGSSNYSSNIE